MNRHILSVLLGLSCIAPLTVAAGQGETRHAWEQVEITLHSQRPYENPHADFPISNPGKSGNFLAGIKPRHSNT